MSKRIYYKSVPVGGGSIITVQSMTNTATADIAGTINQINELESKGCDIVRVAVPDLQSAYAISQICKKIKIPLIADIHFDYRLAIESIKNGASGIRINPGNIGKSENIKMIVDTCKEYHVPIRVGVNSGSVKKEFINRYNGVNEFSMVESALEQVSLIENLGHFNIVVSVKSSDIRTNISANEILRKRIDYPIHLGITEAGTLLNGTIKSSAGLGHLLLKGIGDTIRVSLTEDPVNEVIVGRKLLQFLKIRPYGINIISCPTCGRTKIDIIGISNKLEQATAGIKKDITVAVMGCIVNGPGEGKEADIGIAGGEDEAILFKKGKIIRKIPGNKILQELINEIKEM